MAHRVDRRWHVPDYSELRALQTDLLFIDTAIQKAVLDLTAIGDAENVADQVR